MARQAHHHPNWGGPRQGAGRPQGSRNAPVLLPDMPVTQDPLAWLMALMNTEGARLKLRVDAAKTLMAYFHCER